MPDALEWGFFLNAVAIFPHTPRSAAVSGTAALVIPSHAFTTFHSVGGGIADQLFLSLRRRDDFPATWIWQLCAKRIYWLNLEFAMRLRLTLDSAACMANFR